MSFISLEFSVFLLALLALFVVFRGQRIRKYLLLTASCVFYAYWDWRFLGLLAFVTVIDYSISVLLTRSNQSRHRKIYLLTSIIVNLGLLIYFKYFNFFIDSANAMLGLFGWNFRHLDIILPIGISFYIFETISYVVDVYRGSSMPANSILDYAIFITFFPRLVSGPIMRAQQFLPQLANGINISVDNLITGSQFFLRGAAKKLVIADNLAIFVDKVYADPLSFSSGTTWLAILAYSIQILCDFSGYTDMALGIGQMFGIHLPDNFNLPYTAQSLTEFWQRWHISLSSWLKDYLYIPLGGNRKGKMRTYLNLMITMLLGGLWHGASWNFVLWGGLHGIYLAIERQLGFNETTSAPWDNLMAWIKSLAVFVLVSLTWIFFRSPSLKITLQMFEKIFFVNPAGLNWPFTAAVLLIPLVVIGAMLVRLFSIRYPIFSINQPVAIPLLVVGAVLIFLFAAIDASPFIYFQF